MKETQQKNAVVHEKTGSSAHAPFKGVHSFAGPSSCGKPQTLLGILLHNDQPFDEVIVFALQMSLLHAQKLKAPTLTVKEKKSKARAVLPKPEVLRSPEEVKSITDHLLGNHKQKKATHIVLDDLESEMMGGKSKWADSLVTTGCHHLGISACTLAQQPFVSRTARLQTDTMVLFAFPADTRSVHALARPMSPRDHGQHIRKMHEQATSQPHAHAWFAIDLKADQRREPMLKFCSNSWSKHFAPTQSPAMEKQSFNMSIMIRSSGNIFVGQALARNGVHQGIAEPVPTHGTASVAVACD